MSNMEAAVLFESVASTPPVVFASFSNEDAVALGIAAVDVIRERGLNLAVDVVRGGDLLFRAKLGTTNVENDPWLAGKAATVREYGVPSLLVRLRHDVEGQPFEEREVDGIVLRAAGGSIPLFVDDEIVGTLTMSGEPDTVDHETALAAIAKFVSRNR